VVDLIPIGPNRWQVSGRPGMLVDAVVYMQRGVAAIEDEALQQLADAACLPGVVGRVAGMPDLHTGFGLPIGGVMATSLAQGVVSAGAVGMDINCGVRLLSTNIPVRGIDKPLLRRLMEAIEERVPTGVGKKSRHTELRRIELAELAARGAALVVEMGFGTPADLITTESSGCLPGGDVSVVSKEARSRADQLSTIGGGNHFIELGVVDEVYDPATAATFRLAQGTLSVLIHTGSRGFGHQICTDFSRLMVQAASRYGINLPSKGLAAAPIASPEGQQYLKAMAAAANFAFANRQMITHDVREAFARVFHRPYEEMGLQVVYDVAHNIAKVEEHGGQRVLVHRKGATRALPPGHGENPPIYLNTGHPALIPGSMGTASYVLVGTPLAAETFYSVNHGAGRVLSRTAARKQISASQLQQSLGDVLVNARNLGRLLDEAPGAYKDIHSVVDTLAAIGLTRKVARLRPMAVIKGEGDD